VVLQEVPKKTYSRHLSVVSAISYHSRGEGEQAFGEVAGFLAVGSVL
jgi:hypothetical protein